VDLDGTLIRSDLVWECLILLLKQHPASVLLLPWWLLRGGRSNLKRQLGKRVILDPGNLPYNSDVVEFLRTEREHGRRIVLVTAADQQLAERVADKVGVFEEVYGTKNGTNLKGRNKAELLRSQFGDHGFEYAGDSPADVHVWRVAGAAYVVGTDAAARRAAGVTTLRRHFQRKKSSAALWLGALRVHHWSKNVLLFVPLLLAHKWDLRSFLMTALGVLFFGLCSSGVYILNDLLDLHSDRAHPWKNARPFASGELSIPSGLFAFVILESIALGLGAIVLNVYFAAAMALYLVVTTSYSLRLKKVVLLDVFILSSFYTFRIWAGSLITATPLSNWLLGFSLFLFLSLSMAKRYSELLHASELTASGNSGRGYRACDRELLMSIGTASTFSAVVIFSLYVHSNEVVALYRRPGLLWLMCPLLLYWTCRIWLKAQRGELDEDPVTLAMRDRVSYLVGALGFAIIILASPIH
jgi:4-hydroxybenzoate polyprenyltransferase